MLNDLHSVLSLNVLNHLADVKFLREVIAFLSLKFYVCLATIFSQFIPQFWSIKLLFGFVHNVHRRHRLAAVKDGILIQLLRRHAAPLNTFRQ